MAKRRKEVNDEKEIVQMLKEHGFTEITKDDKKQFWYKQDLEQLENWRREELGKPFTVRERKALYGTDQIRRHT